ncbi:MAG: YolD-like family protein [Acholeplasmatales bacterium]|nr:YolD-like family protein [Acholeplasmatales bacterium]
MQNINRHGINFKAFDALEGLKDSLKEIEYQFFKEKKIELSDDQKEDINNNLIEALKNNNYILVKYYEDGYYKFHTGEILKVDKCLVFKDSFKIELNDLCEALIV